MTRIAVGVEYLGTAFAGWQTQDGPRSVQAVLEAALSEVADEPINLICAGRTDAGVHAREQVAHFDTHAQRSLRTWVLGANSNLSPDVSLAWAMPVPMHFHARYSAESRTYRYFIFNRGVRSSLVGARAAFVHRPLDQGPMEAAAPFLLGEHDFQAFRSAQCQAHSTIRRLTRLGVTRGGDWIVIEVTANAFLHHMVRNIAGTLIAIGRGEHPPQWAREVLEGRDRTLGAATAPADGLYFWKAAYPDAFGLPTAQSVMMPFL